MTAYDKVAILIERIAAATGAIRIRSDEVARLERNGGTTAEMQARLDVVVGRLERVANELEATLA